MPNLPIIPGFTPAPPAVPTVPAGVPAAPAAGGGTPPLPPAGGGGGNPPLPPGGGGGGGDNPNDPPAPAATVPDLVALDAGLYADSAPVAFEAGGPHTTDGVPFPDVYHNPVASAYRGIDPNSKIASRYPIVNRLNNNIIYPDAESAQAMQNALETIAAIKASGGSLPSGNLAFPPEDKDRGMSLVENVLSLAGALGASNRPINFLTRKDKDPASPHGLFNPAPSDQAKGFATNLLRDGYDEYTALMNSLNALSAYIPHLFSYKGSDGNSADYDMTQLVSRGVIPYPETATNDLLKDMFAASIRANLGWGGENSLAAINKALIKQPDLTINSKSLGQVLAGGTVDNPVSVEYERARRKLIQDESLSNNYAAAYSLLRDAASGALEDISKGYQVSTDDLDNLFLRAVALNPKFSYGDNDYYARLAESNPELAQLAELGDLYDDEGNPITLPVLPGPSYLNLPFIRKGPFGRPMRAVIENDKVANGEYQHGMGAFAPVFGKVEIDQNGGLQLFDQTPLDIPNFSTNPAGIDQSMFDIIQNLHDRMVDTNPIYASLLRNVLYHKLALNFGTNPNYLSALPTQKAPTAQ